VAAANFERPASPIIDVTEEEDEELESEEAMLAQLGKLPEDERSRVMGKICVLKVWPWPPSNWWIASHNPEEAPGTIDDQTDISDDARIKNSFATFLRLDMGLDTEEWMSPRFKREVLLFLLSLTY
jgi:hypothetical protein